MPELVIENKSNTIPVFIHIGSANSGKSEHSRKLSPSSFVTQELNDSTITLRVSTIHGVMSWEGTVPVTTLSYYPETDTLKMGDVVIPQQLLTVEDAPRISEGNEKNQESSSSGRYWLWILIVIVLFVLGYLFLRNR